MPRVKQATTCHPNRKNVGLGLCGSCYNRAWRQKNPERYRALRRKHVKTYRSKLTTEQRRIQPERLLLGTAKRRAKAKGLDFDITRNDIVIPQKCPVLGIPLVPYSGSCNHNSPTIDRIDNSKGYVRGNIIVVSFRANSLKNNATMSELRRIVDFYEAL